ncbi:MAG TPA: molybdopterin-dependent oxidoreductase [Conexibacter sp.]|nr:molybdopterin-dependent oxidoreductase [Conexibacter sp.]
MVRRPRPALGERLRDADGRRRPLADLVERELAFARVGPFRADAFSSRLHDERTAALLGIALGACFLVCFATGLITQFAQHPLDVGFLSMPASPGWLYRVTQGAHVATGTLAVPLLLAKLWTVYPRLFTWPPIRGAAHALERISLVPLVAGSLFQLGSGLANGAHWRPWSFDFPVAHYWTAWIVIGALIVHVGAKLPVTRRALGRAARAAPEPAGSGLSRRGFLTTAFAAAGVITLTTVGQTVRPLRQLALLAPRRPDVGPQGVPVNKAASGAGVVEAAQDPGYRLVVDGDVARPLRLSRDELLALPQHSAELSIACVEGWSSAAVWGGVPIRDLVALAGGDPERCEVVVHSLQESGSYSRSRLNEPHVRERDSLLALTLRGEPLHLDHGYPCRLIAPNRPGVQQTKWVARLEVV